MSYNPLRASGQLKHRRRKNNPHAGIKHSDIMRRRGVGSAAPSARTGQKTDHGFRSEVFKCDAFTQYYACMYHGNLTGFGFNNSGDKTVHVVRGSLFVISAGIVELDGEFTIAEKTTRKVKEGGYINLPAGLGYSLATTGTTDAELVVTETADYNSDWHPLEAAQINNEVEIMLVAPDADKPGRRNNIARQNSKAMQAAQGENNRRRGRAQGAVGSGNAASSNANSVAVVGVNPRPGGVFGD